MPQGHLDLGQSAYQAFDRQGWAGVRHVFLPLVLVSAYAMSLVRNRVEGFRIRIVGAMVLSVLTPGAFLLSLIIALVVSTGVQRLAGRTSSGGIFVGRAD